MNAKQWHRVFSVEIGITLSVLGLIGNFISIIVWNRIIKRQLRGNASTGIFLIALGICDSSLLFFFLLTDSIRAQYPEIDHNYSYVTFFSYIGFPLFFISLTSSIWMVIGITVNRFVMIQFPTKVRDLYTTTTTLLGIFGILSFALAINFPHFFTYHAVTDVNGTVSLQFTEFGNSKESKYYEFWAHCIFVVLAPWFSIAVLNGLIICKLKEQMKKFQNDGPSGKKTKQERQERQMTMMLLSVTFSFLVFLAWQCVTQCFWMLGYGKSEERTVWETVDTAFAFAKMGVILNSSINWFLYCITSSIFRKEMRKCFYSVKKNASIPLSSTFSSQATLKDTIIVNSNA